MGATDFVQKSYRDWGRGRGDLGVKTRSNGWSSQPISSLGGGAPSGKSRKAVDGPAPSLCSQAVADERLNTRQ